MSKMRRYFSNKVSKITWRWGFPLLAPLNIRFDDLKLRHLPKLCFFNWLSRNRTLKKSVMTSFQWRHCYYVTENIAKLKLQDFSILGPSQSKCLATPVDYASNAFPNKAKFSGSATLQPFESYNGVIDDTFWFIKMTSYNSLVYCVHTVYALTKVVIFPCLQ